MKTNWFTYFHEMWLKLTIKKKIIMFTGAVFSAILLSIAFDFWIIQYTLGDFQEVLEDNLRAEAYMEAIENESKLFNNYIKNPSDGALDELEKACIYTKIAVDKLPFHYQKMSELRYAKTWSIQSGYETYAQARDHIIYKNALDDDYIKNLYEIYNMQQFLQEYARVLMRLTLEDENIVYQNKIPGVRRIPYFILIFGSLLLWCVVWLAKLMYEAIIVPIVRLVTVSKKIASNDFFVEDVESDNKDEMGELVKAFNKMKYATGQYITTLEDNRRTIDLLHAEELERLEVEKRFEMIKFELLKSQIDPHFLFNTLNVIGGMANLEEADTTEKMIKALSSLFRYNLKTKEAEVALAQEIRVVKDYMYLQQMRFGDRITYSLDCSTELYTAIVPTFTFQPLVENAIIHGLSKREEGGKIDIRIWLDTNLLNITIADTGIGMTKEKLLKLRKAFGTGDTQRLGIGLGNIYKRIHGMYENGVVEVYSKLNEGTVIKLIIPQGEWEVKSHV